jgi:glycosyltransferase involved in cell wall biosynthesis
VGVFMKKIVNIVNNISSTSIPVEVANKLGDTDFKSILISLYDSPKDVNEKTNRNNILCESYGIGLKNKFNMRKIYNLYKLLKKINPDIIHIHHTYSGIIASVISEFLKDCYLVSTVHNDLRFFNSYQRYLRYISYLLSDVIICNSSNTKKTLFSSIKNKKNIEVVYNGIDIKKIIKNNKNNKESIDNDMFIISNVAMLTPQKDQLSLLRAFKIFVDKSNSTNTKLILVGDGVLRNKLQKFIRSNKLENQITLTGLITRDKVFQIINNSKIFVMSSKYEGFCNAMVEAMVAENAVIASNVDPLPEVLGKNNGLFFEQGNAEDLADEMCYLYKNEKIRKGLASKAKEYAINNYSLEKCVDEYKKVYQELLS